MSWWEILIRVAAFIFLAIVFLRIIGLFIGFPLTIIIQGIRILAKIFGWDEEGKDRRMRDQIRR